MKTQKNHQEKSIRAVCTCKRIFGLGVLFCSLTGYEQVLAQELSLPPERRLIDQNGVDLLSDQFTASQTDIDIGPQEANLAYTRWNSSNTNGTYGYVASTDIFMQFIDGTMVSIEMNGSMEVFDVSGSTYTVKNGMGSTLVFDASSQNYVYTLRDGTVIRFPADDPTAHEWRGLRAISILAPNGLLTEFHVKKWIPEEGWGWWTRVQSVSNNAGYQLKLEYDDPIRIIWPTKVYALNRTVAYCDPTADSCPATAGAPNATLSWIEQTPNDITLVATDPAGGQTRWTMDGLTGVSGLTGTKSRSAIEDDTTATFEYMGMTGVRSVTRRGMTWDYQILNPYFGTPTFKVTDPLGAAREVTVDMINTRLLIDKDELGNATSYQYDSFGRRTEVIYPEGDYIHVTYDGRGNILEKRHVAKPGSSMPDIVESATYEETCSNPKTCNKPTSTTDARGRVTDYTYDPTHGGVLTVTEPAPYEGGIRSQTRYTYQPSYAWYKDSAGNFVQAPTPIYKVTRISMCRTTASCENAADEVRTTFTYQSGSSSVGSNLLLVAITQSAGDGSLSRTTSFGYDSRGNRVTVDGPLAGAVDVITTRYDLARQVVGVIGPDPDDTGPLKRRAIRYSYNLDYQPMVVERGTVDGLSDANWTAFSSLEQTNLTYDQAGRRASASISSAGAILDLTQFSYDAAGHLECVARRMTPSTFGAPPSSACTSVTAGEFGPDRITKATYDPVGRVSKTQSGYDTGFVRDERSTSYTGNGKVQTVTDARSNVTTYEYDAYDRLYRVYYPVPSDYEEFSYDEAGNLTAKRLRDGQTIGYSYDGQGRLQSRYLPGSEPDVTYGYDNLGHATSVSQSGQTLTFGYDALGRLRTQTGPQGTLTSDYDAADRRYRLTWADGFYVDYDYLFTGEVTKIKENGVTSGVGVLVTYAYDNLGRRVALTRGNGTVTSYAYDGASRLQHLTQDLGSMVFDQTVDFTYNPADQIRTRASNNDSYSWTQNQNTSRSYSANALNQYASMGWASPTYDGRGNFTSLGTGTGSYSYSSDNRLTNAPGAVSLSYDPLGRLYQTTWNGAYTRFTYDSNDLVAEYSASNQLLRRYVHGPSDDEPLVWYEGGSTATRRWLHADERGSIIAISDASGVKYAINRYDEHGVPESTNAGRFQFTGQMWIPEVQLYYFKARFYSPALGRFMQPDPIGYMGGMNLYAYASGDVVNRRDPSGLLDDDTWEINGDLETVEITGYRCPGICMTFDEFWDRYGAPSDWHTGPFGTTLATVTVLGKSPQTKSDPGPAFTEQYQQCLNENYGDVLSLADGNSLIPSADFWGAFGIGTGLAAEALKDTQYVSNRQKYQAMDRNSYSPKAWSSASHQLSLLKVLKGVDVASRAIGVFATSFAITARINCAIRAY